ncbi:hypothetical protein RRG08_062614 [Elysia crispata]|uniref:Uncharacterized protein n=1 Tax=Elysia crispata TaxID=231223 RepID=A0AAE1D6T9_9GAST|nr:hypothetical protein RRG08_062614 [Elysia crispata]
MFTSRRHELLRPEDEIALSSLFRILLGLQMSGHRNHCCHNTCPLMSLLLLHKALRPARTLMMLVWFHQSLSCLGCCRVQRVMMLSPGNPLRATKARIIHHQHSCLAQPDIITLTSAQLT